MQRIMNENLKCNKIISGWRSMPEDWTWKRDLVGSTKRKEHFISRNVNLISVEESEKQGFDHIFRAGVGLCWLCNLCRTWFWFTAGPHNNLSSNMGQSIWPFHAILCTQRGQKSGGGNTSEEEIRKMLSTSVHRLIQTINQRFISHFIMRTVNSFRRWEHYYIFTSVSSSFFTDLKQHSVRARNRPAAPLCSKSISLLISSFLYFFIFLCVRRVTVVVVQLSHERLQSLNGE